MIWAEGFGPRKVMEKSEYFVYCGFFITHDWVKRFAQITKGRFVEVPIKKKPLTRVKPYQRFCSWFN